MRQTILTLLMLVAGNLCAQVQFSNPSGSLKVQLKKTDSKQELVLSNASGLELTHITLGLRSSTADYTSGLILTGTSDIAEVQTEYTALHGKRRQVSNAGNAQTLHFRNIAGCTARNEDGLSICEVAYGVGAVGHALDFDCMVHEAVNPSSTLETTCSS